MKLSILLFVGFSFLEISCGTSNEQDKCLGIQNPCEKIDETKCSSDLKSVKTCSMNADGCLVWTQTDSCDGNRTCSSGQCVCVDMCNKQGETRCSEDKLQTCKEGQDGCLVWATTTDCAADNKHCDDSGDVPVCSQECVNKCDTAGNLRCSGDVIQTCAADDAGCLDWSDTTDCAADNEHCDDSGDVPVCNQECVNKCDTAGDLRCSGDVIQTCTADNSGCLDWADTTDCAADNKHCDDSGDVPVCQQGCTDECDTVDALRCNLFTIQRCELGADSCKYWRDSQDCTESNQFCQQPQDGTAHCATCEPPAEGCEQGERCTMSNFGVFFCLPAGNVQEGGDCSSSDCQAGLICLDGTCVSYCENASECTSPDQHCVWAWPELGTSWGVCRPGCDPILQTGCSGEESACYYSDPEAGTTECWMPGSLQEGDDCSDMTQFCAPGLDCVLEPNTSDPFEYYCRAYCDIEHPCPDGKTCQSTSHMVMLPVCL